MTAIIPLPPGWIREGLHCHWRGCARCL